MLFSLTLLEIIILMAGAIGLGLTIHFFIVSRKNLKHLGQHADTRKVDEWKNRYFNDIEKKDQEILKALAEVDSLKKQMEELEESNENLKYKLSKSAVSTAPSLAVPETSNFIQELVQTQKGLVEQNRRITEMLESLQHLQDTASTSDDLRVMNEELTAEVDELRAKLAAKEKEISEIRQTSKVSHEMSSMLDNAYREFNVLQEKIIKLEGQLNSSQRITMEYEDLREGFVKASRDLEEQRSRLNEVMSENRELHIELSESNEKLREANFQRQQLQKRISYLEEMNQDLQSVAEANRKLEGQLKRLGELESLLNVMAEERDQLARSGARASSL